VQPQHQQYELERATEQHEESLHAAFPLSVCSNRSRVDFSINLKRTRPTKGWAEKISELCMGICGGF